MKVFDDDLLWEFRRKRTCEYCKHPLHYYAHPHHVHSRGAGRVDISCNLIALGAAFDCNCHGRVHSGSIERMEILTIVARREGKTIEEIEQEVWRLRRADKTEPLHPCSAPPLAPL